MIGIEFSQDSITKAQIQELVMRNWALKKSLISLLRKMGVSGEASNY